MKTLLTLSIFLLLGSHGPLAQRDSLRFAQDTGRVEKQRFMDTYDYFFMTKEPTKWMLKLTNDGQSFNGFSPFWLRFEKKITPALSVQFGVSPTIAPVYNNNQLGGYLVGKSVMLTPIIGSGIGLNSKLKLATTGEVRWYYDLKKRIAAGESVNNFSANYFSLRYNNVHGVDDVRLFPNNFLVSYDGKQWKTNYDFSQIQNQITLQYGIQRRFLRFGLIDFSVGLSRTSSQSYNRKVVFKDGDNSIKPPNTFKYDFTSTWTANNPDVNWQLGTNLRLGLAFGDFKKSQKRPLCDVLQCYESEKSLFKVSWPNISLGFRSQFLSGALAYERKLFNSAFSVSVMVEFMGSFAQNQRFQTTSTGSFNGNSSYMGIKSYLQPRYYFTQARRIRKHNGGNNLSGLYGGTSVILSQYNIQFGDNNKGNLNNSRVGAGPTIGFQQKLFRNGFFDFQTSFTRNIVIGNSNFITNTPTELHISLNLGFAF